MLNSGKNQRFFVTCDLEIWWMILKNNRAPLLYYVKLCASLQIHWWSQTWVTPWKRSSRVKIGDLFVPCDLENWRMTLKTIGHPSYVASTFVHHFIADGEFKLELQSGKHPIWVKIDAFLAVWPWNLTDDLEENRVSLLSNIKLCASFHCHMWIQTGVTVRQPLNGVMTSLTLTFDLWPWPFAWTSCLSIVIAQENFRMIWWEEHCQKGVTDGQTDRRK